MEMKRHGEIEYVQVFAKANIHTSTFANEAYATAAVAALAQKIPASWNVPKVHMIHNGRSDTLSCLEAARSRVCLSDNQRCKACARACQKM